MPGRDLNLLSLDGGGVRGLSSLQILKQLMEMVAVEADLEILSRPWIMNVVKDDHWHRRYH